MTDDNGTEDKPEDYEQSLRRALTAHDYQLCAIIIQAMILRAINEHEDVYHADK